jgi:hypothetical protein
VGLAVGVALFIAVLGTPVAGEATVLAYQRGTWVLAATSVLAALIGLVTLRRRPVAQAASQPAAAEPAVPTGPGEPRETVITGVS